MAFAESNFTTRDTSSVDRGSTTTAGTAFCSVYPSLSYTINSSECVMRPSSPTISRSSGRSRLTLVGISSSIAPFVHRSIEGEQTHASNRRNENHSPCPSRPRPEHGESARVAHHVDATDRPPRPGVPAVDGGNQGDAEVRLPDG